MVAKLITNSAWWARAAQTHDRHYAEDEPVTVADHLTAVARNVNHVLVDPEPLPYAVQVRDALVNQGMEPGDAAALLYVVALLHDIGKPLEDKDGVMSHPATGEIKPARHPLIGMSAALELLPPKTPHRVTIIGLVENHAIPFGWYCQSQASGVVPAEKAWARLGRKIDPADDARGIMLLALFKLADIDGHADRSDVIWFVDQANTMLLRKRGRWLPAPPVEFLGEMP